MQRIFLTFLLGLAASLLLPAVPLVANPPSAPKTGLEGIIPLFSAADIDAERIEELLQGQPRAVVVEVSADRTHEDYATLQRMLSARKIALLGWIEVARHVELAEAHPQWMAGMGVHENWRRRFPEFPATGEGEVVKIFPWVPVWYGEAFDAHLSRIEQLLQHADIEWDGLFLHNIQGAPSACGCGNAQCRWTVDYQTSSTATKLQGDDAPARFVSRVQELTDAPVIPVWYTECEAIDMHHHEDSTGYNGAVGCVGRGGACWPNLNRQLEAVAAAVGGGQVAIAGFYKELGRDLPQYKDQAAWVGEIIRMLQDPPHVEPALALAPDRLIVVVQGWNVSKAEIEAQIAAAKATGASAVIVSHLEVDTSWEPQHLQK